MLGVELGDDGFDDVVEDFPLVEVVPGVAQDEEVAVVDAGAAVEEGAGGKHLEQAHHATIRQRDPLTAQLETQALVGGQELLGELHLVEEGPPAGVEVRRRQQRLR